MWWRKKLCTNVYVHIERIFANNSPHGDRKQKPKNKTQNFGDDGKRQPLTVLLPLFFPWALALPPTSNQTPPRPAPGEPSILWVMTREHPIISIPTPGNPRLFPATHSFEKHEEKERNLVIRFTNAWRGRALFSWRNKAICRDYTYLKNFLVWQ